MRLEHEGLVARERHRVAHDICSRLHSQVVRFQFRTVLAPGRSAKSLQEHAEIVGAVAGPDRIAIQRPRLA